jgi:hypothetical protein
VKRCAVDLLRSAEGFVLPKKIKAMFPRPVTMVWVAGKPAIKVEYPALYVACHGRV